MKPSRTGTLTSLELCAGGGGAALGLEEAGFAPVALVENDPHACATLRRNRPYWTVMEADLKRFEAGYWKCVEVVSGGDAGPRWSWGGAPEPAGGRRRDTYSVGIKA